MMDVETSFSSKIICIIEASWSETIVCALVDGRSHKERQKEKKICSCHRSVCTLKYKCDHVKVESMGVEHS